MIVVKFDMVGVVVECSLVIVGATAVTSVTVCVVTGTEMSAYLGVVGTSPQGSLFVQKG